jgi:predicted SAM-dependent methyltransferase
MKLHLGCGARYIPGFIHIDAVNFPHVDHISAVDDLAFIQTSSVDLIYTCHVLEHFPRRRTTAVLAEWLRVLKPGGLLRVSVPDFSMLCKIYHETSNIENVIGPLFGRQDYLYNIHYNVYDWHSLHKVLTGAGFVNIKRYDWRATDHAHIDDYAQAYFPHMQKETGTPISLNVEAFKAYSDIDQSINALDVT